MVYVTQLVAPLRSFSREPSSSPRTFTTVEDEDEMRDDAGHLNASCHPSVWLFITIHILFSPYFVGSITT
ncbi:hypothetical protein V2G26_020688 [Clonostachys chloroleuca]